MSNPETQLEHLLRTHGFVLVRQRKHKVYRNPSGRIFVTSSTPSDHRWASNALRQLRDVLDSPAKPEVIAISEFEREEAARVITGQSQQAVGMQGSGKSKRSRGTGFHYYDQVPTDETLAQREALAAQARANRIAKRERRAQRKQETALARAHAEALQLDEQLEFDGRYSGFMDNVIIGAIEKFEETFARAINTYVRNDPWVTDFYWEFPEDSIERRYTLLLFKDDNMLEKDFVEFRTTWAAQHLELIQTNAAQLRAKHVLDFVKKQLKSDPEMYTLVYQMVLSTDKDVKNDREWTEHLLYRFVASVIKGSLEVKCEGLGLSEDEVFGVFVNGDHFDVITHAELDAMDAEEAAYDAAQAAAAPVEPTTETAAA